MMIAVVLLAVAVPLFAQEAEQPDFFVVNIPINKLYLHSKGYVVSYMMNSVEKHRVYLPFTWFKRNGTDPFKGEIVRLKPGTTWPHLTVVYNKGEFSHVKLYLRPEFNHFSWGNLPPDADLDSAFDNTTTINLKFNSYGSSQ